jgi:hypothetical protein
VDGDGDGVCAPLDECDGIPNPDDIVNLDGDLLCDGLDPDDDNDGFLDEDELAAGSDPRDANSTPTEVLATAADFDGDGLSNALEQSLGMSPFRADTDSDGATDFTELMDAGGGAYPFAALNWGNQPHAVIATTAALGTSESLVAPSGMPPMLSTASGAIRAMVTGGQSTPLARQEGAGKVILWSGLQPQLLLGADGDGDGLSGFDEFIAGTSLMRVDSDGDGFVDGEGDQVLISDYQEGFDLDGDGFIDGEIDSSSDPVNPASHVGFRGDVAPLGTPDGAIGFGDVVVMMRIVDDAETTLGGLSSPIRSLTEEAADVTSPQGAGSNDLLVVMQWAKDSSAIPAIPDPPDDSDFDGLADSEDNCGGIANDQADSDGDGIGDACDTCPLDENSNQSDIDADMIGDVCDDDDDGDTWVDVADNCPWNFNPQQTDTDNDSIGDACD